MFYTYREAALNWLAFGLLLAAWNASDDTVPSTAQPPPRPEALRGHAHVSVRAAARAAVVQRVHLTVTSNASNGVGARFPANA